MEIPEIIPESDEEKKRLEDAKNRSEYRLQALMKQYAILSLSLLSASGQKNILRVIIYFSLAFIYYPAK